MENEEFYSYEDYSEDYNEEEYYEGPEFTENPEYEESTAVEDYSDQIKTDPSTVDIILFIFVFLVALLAIASLIHISVIDK